MSYTSRTRFKKKLSTIVSTKDINRFQLAYSNLLKANMDTLKKKAKETKSGQTTTTTTLSTNSPTSPTSSNQRKKTTPIVVGKKNDK